MRILKAFGMLGFLLPVGLLTGCFKTTHAVTKALAPNTYKTASVEELEKRISDHDAALKTLNAQSVPGMGGGPAYG